MKLFLFMLILINPFSQMLFLRELYGKLEFKVFLSVQLKATFYAFLIFITFAVVGQPILTNFFQVRIESLRIFGGLVNLYIAYRYVAVGEGSVVLFKDNLSELAPNITLPYMVGPGLIWTSILIGETYPVYMACGIIVGVLAINTAFCVMGYRVFGTLDGSRETLFAKELGMLTRIMALFIGAIGVEMLLGGLEDFYRNSMLSQ